MAIDGLVTDGLVTEEQVRNHAHMLWEKAGRPEGREDEFWHAAEAELNAGGSDKNQPNKTTMPG